MIYSSLKVSFYKKKNGKEPVKDLLNKLPLEERSDAYARLTGIENYSFQFYRVTFKPIKGKLWEIKYQHKNQHRILYCLKNDTTIVLLHYVKKKTQKLAAKEIKIAENRMIEVLRNEE